MTKAWLICREPVHIGGADSENRGNNNPVFRLPDRSPAIPGSSLRGALREHATAQNEYKDFIRNWFGGENKEGDTISPGAISLGWGWPMWWPIHVLGYGNWWVSCPTWLNRYQQLHQQPPLELAGDHVYVTERALDKQTVYLRWLKLTDVMHTNIEELPAPSNDEVPADRRIIVPDRSINLLVDMGLVRQPRVSLLDAPDAAGNLVQNLFAVEGYPPGAVFLFTWATRGKVENAEKWQAFLKGEHFLGGLWGVGYGRVFVSPIAQKE
jgi:CRISPR/Cas system CMR subunit Cmr4 (Cas7 group RAMP superfamily)